MRTSKFPVALLPVPAWYVNEARLCAHLNEDEQSVRLTEVPPFAYSKNVGSSDRAHVATTVVIAALERHQSRCGRIYLDIGRYLLSLQEEVAAQRRRDAQRVAEVAHHH